MNATKRKFNALLNGLGNKSTNSLPSEANDETTSRPAASTDETGLKKRKVARTLDILSKPPLTRVRQPLRNSSLNLRTHKKSQSATQAEVSSEKPKYAPWDRDAFLDRLKSFSSLTDWAPKPAKVNEVEWAKRGWVCQKKERVRCCLCNIEILVGLNKKQVEGKEEPVYVPSQIEEPLVARYAEMIITSHAEHCLWRQRGCDETIFKLPLNNASATLEAIRGRYDSLCALQNLVPYMHNLRFPGSFSLKTNISYLPKDFFKPATSPASVEPISDKITGDFESTVDRAALTLAFFGWHSRLGSLPSYGTASCGSCFRNLGLWLFRSKEVNEAGEEMRPASMAYLDVVEEHRDYCPWRNSHSQSGDSKSSQTELAAWEVVLRVLKNDHYLKRAGENEPQKNKRPVTAIESSGDLENPFEIGLEEDADAKSIREEKDKERWARLRRVKSLFDTKSSKRMSKAASNEAEKKS